MYQVDEETLQLVVGLITNIFKGEYINNYLCVKLDKVPMSQHVSMGTYDGD